MEGREKFGLRKPLALWNLLLVVFNLYAFYYLAPAVLGTITKGIFTEALCDLNASPFTRGPQTFALFCFAISKVRQTWRAGKKRGSSYALARPWLPPHS
jgi:hypothetical protein